MHRRRHRRSRHSACLGPIRRGDHVAVRGWWVEARHSKFEQRHQESNQEIRRVVESRGVPTGPPRPTRPATTGLHGTVCVQALTFSASLHVSCILVCSGAFAARLRDQGLPARAPRTAMLRATRRSRIKRRRSRIPRSARARSRQTPTARLRLGEAFAAFVAFDLTRGDDKACLPNRRARPLLGRLTVAMSAPLLTSTQEMTEFEFHNSPVSRCRQESHQETRRVVELRGVPTAPPRRT